ncbi:MAG: methyltransferase domain-containing protein, partial [Acidimicrobiales bacterium]
PPSPAVPPSPAFAPSPLERALAAEYDARPELADRWLLAQTLATSASRRQLAAELATALSEEGPAARRAPGARRILDVGTGFGALPLELALGSQVEAFGVDSSPAALEVALSAQRRLETAGALAAGSTVRWHLGDAGRLPFPDASFDLACAQLVFQHLADRAAAAAEMARVLRPGGQAWILDVDDGMSVSWPEPSAAETALREALALTQAVAGGDRRVGRKLAACLEAAGFEVVSVEVRSQAGFGVEPALSRAFTLERFRRARAAVLRHGTLGAGRYDSLLEAFAAEPLASQLAVSTQVLAVGRRAAT